MVSESSNVAVRVAILRKMELNAGFTLLYFSQRVRPQQEQGPGWPPGNPILSLCLSLEMSMHLFCQ